MSRAGAGVRARFVATILLGSFLLFLVQPMVARLALPRLGGAPAVWNSAMLVYQALLLAGYAYAHWLGARAPRNQPVIHLALFAVAGLTLPIGLIAAFPSADASPFLWVPWLLLASVGPLFFVVAAQAPLVQRWYALAGGGDPYPLYAASNFGSFAGLLSYPLLVEPMLSVGAQRWLWSIGYVLLAALVLWCARALPQEGADERAAAAPRAAPPPWRERLAWIALAAVPSGLILSTTLHLSTDIGALPLLWVIPLGLYLLSFTLAFSARAGPARFFSLLAPVLLLTTACGLFADSRGMAVLFGIVALAALFAVSVALHRQLFDRRPEPAQLTLFYLLLSVGGALGGLFAALIAPLLFNWTAEHPLLLLAAAALLAARSPFERAANLWDASPTSRTVTALLVALLLVLALAGKGLFGLPYSSTVSSYALFAILAVGIVAIGNRLLLTAAIAALMLNVGGWERIELSLQQGALTRSYFGVYTVRPKSDGGRWLIHGTTVHGIQNLGTAERERTPTSYYVPEAGVGRALGAAARLFGPAARIGIVGLGAGTLACYARPGQRWTFFEIDPVVVRIARDSGQFTFLARCTPRVPIVLGDARISLANAAPGSLDLLVVDAFSSDSVPLHLLTAEAFAVYRRALSERGLLLVHVSNRYFRLQPAVAAAARAGGWSARELNFSPTDKRRSDNATGSMWVALSPSAQSIRQLTADDPRAWKPLPVQRGFEAWTDDHASVLPLIRWR